MKERRNSVNNSLIDDLHKITYSHDIIFKIYLIYRLAAIYNNIDNDTI